MSLGLTTPRMAERCFCRVMKTGAGRPGDGGPPLGAARGEKQGERRGASVGHAWVPQRSALAAGARLLSVSSPRTGRAPVAAGGGAPRSLHSKLLSPERFKRDPDETRRLAAEKQRRAERQRSVLEAERKAKLEKVRAVCARTALCRRSGAVGGADVPDMVHVWDGRLEPRW